MKYAHIETKTNKLLGWYDDEIHATIPSPNIEVTEEVWQKALDINANAYENNNFIVKDFRTEAEIKDEEIVNKIHESKEYLSSTDWYTARKIDSDTPIPEDVVAKRLEARALINELEG